MTNAQLAKLVRNFPENGPKLLLENGSNVRDLLRLLREPIAEVIDFEAMTVLRTHFIQPDFRHVALDMLLKAPCRVGSSGDPRSIFVYLEGGFFGQVLRLIQQRHADGAVFTQLLGEVVAELEKMSLAEPRRRFEFLSFILALLHHTRGEQEQQRLQEVVDRSVQTNRKEYVKMGRTIAEMLEDRGWAKGKIEGEIKGEIKEARAILLMLLRKRFKKLPRKMEAHIAAVDDLHQLRTWLANIVDAQTLADVGIPLS